MARRVSPVGARELFLRWLGEGLSTRECARLAGVDGRVGRRWAMVAGLARPRGHGVKDPARVAELVELIRAGVGACDAAERVGVSARVGRYWSARVGEGHGVPVWQIPRQEETSSVIVDMDARPGQRLGPRDRLEITVGQAKGWTVSRIAGHLGRPVSTVSRELKRNTSPDGQYRFVEALQAARDRARRPKRVKLGVGTVLHDVVSVGLADELSPEQISHRLRLEYPDQPEMNVCHETIYQALYMQARGGLKREVATALRSGRTYRKPHRHHEERRGRIRGMIPISERPAEVEDRAVPGHWEGDLIIGSMASNTAVATLVERSTRLTLLVGLPHGHTAAQTRDALVPLIAGLPERLRRSLTWDQGVEMAAHLQIAAQADIDIFFADPHSPWQRGSNENTNGLLRQYMPKGTDLSVHTPEDLNRIAAKLNSRPRKTLGWLTPAETYALTLGIPITIGGRPAHLPDTLIPLTQRCVDP